MAIEQQAPQEEPAAPAMAPVLHPAGPAEGARRWLAIGTGVGIEIGETGLRIVIVRVRPGGARVVAAAEIERFAERPATEWGAEYAALARKWQVSGIPVTVLLPRRDVIVRHLALPGVEDRDLAAAVTYQVESLHPWAEGEVAHTFARMPGTSAVLVGLAQQETIDRFSNLFMEAGIRLAGFSFAAAALASASRVLVKPPASFLALHGAAASLEAYGESPARAVFSGWFEDEPQLVEQRALAELRCGDDVPVGGFADLLPAPLRTPEMFEREAFAPAYAAAITSACPRLSLPANLLPMERRSQAAGWIYVPSAVLAVALVAAAVLLAWQPSYHDKRYLARLETEIRTLEKQAAEATRMDAAMEDARQRMEMLDKYRLRSRADADALRELTLVLQPPSWIQSLQLGRSELMIAGETEQAAALLKMIDSSPLFKDSTFVQGVSRTGSAEQFNIRAQREEPPPGATPASAPAPPQPQQQAPAATPPQQAPPGGAR